MPLLSMDSKGNVNESGFGALASLVSISVVPDFKFSIGNGAYWYREGDTAATSITTSQDLTPQQKIAVYEAAIAKALAYGKNESYVSYFRNEITAIKNYLEAEAAKEEARRLAEIKIAEDAARLALDQAAATRQYAIDLEEKERQDAVQAQMALLATTAVQDSQIEETSAIEPQSNIVVQASASDLSPQSNIVLKSQTNKKISDDYLQHPLTKIMQRI